MIKSKSVFELDNERERVPLSFLSQPVYDTELVHEGVDSYFFFQRPLGYTTFKDIVKTESETNMLVPNRVTPPHVLYLFGISVNFYVQTQISGLFYSRVSTVFSKDVSSCLKATGAFEFSGYEHRRVLLRAALSVVPDAIEDTAKQQDRKLFFSLLMSSGEKQRCILFEAGDFFQVKLYWPNGFPAIRSFLKPLSWWRRMLFQKKTCSVRAVVMLHGYLGSAV